MLLSHPSIGTSYPVDARIVEPRGDLRLEYFSTTNLADFSITVGLWKGWVGVALSLSPLSLPLSPFSGT